MRDFYKLLHWKNKYLRRLLCNALIQPHFDYACSAQYRNLSKKTKSRVQTLQNKCIRFCLQLDKMSHISQKEFETINQLPIKERYHRCVNSIAFKHFHNQCPYYLNEVFMKAPESSSSLRSSYKNFSNLSVKLTLVKMPYLTLVQHCGIKSKKKSKEQQI